MTGAPVRQRLLRATFRTREYAPLKLHVELMSIGQFFVFVGGRLLDAVRQAADRDLRRGNVPRPLILDPVFELDDQGLTIESRPWSAAAANGSVADAHLCTPPKLIECSITYIIQRKMTKELKT
jgi:hypothetical protein